MYITTCILLHVYYYMYIIKVSCKLCSKQDCNCNKHILIECYLFRVLYFIAENNLLEDLGGGGSSLPITNLKSFEKLRSNYIYLHYSCMDVTLDDVIVFYLSLYLSLPLSLPYPLRPHIPSLSLFLSIPLFLFLSSSASPSLSPFPFHFPSPSPSPSLYRPPPISFALPLFVALSFSSPSTLPSLYFSLSHHLSFPSPPLSLSLSLYISLHLSLYLSLHPFLHLSLPHSLHHSLPSPSSSTCPSTSPSPSP